MTKYLLLIALAVVVWWMWRKAQAARLNEPSAPTPRAAEAMVKCAHCGVNQPLSESIQAGELFYCSAAHQRAAEGS